ncbi:MAG: hypothetical protein ACI3WR_00780 [Oscillospiraceae bacterium]
MKKTLTVILAAAMLALALSACGGSKEPAGEQGAAPGGTPEEIIEAVYAEKSVGLNLMTMAVDLGDADAVQYNLGLADASKVKEAAVSEPMMGSQAYSLAVVRVNDAADAESVANDMLSGINQSKWICVEADDLKVMTKGDVVLLFMVSSSFADTVTADEMEAAFTAVCGGSPDLVLEK